MKPKFSIETDSAGQGCCVIASFGNDHREVVAGFATEHDASSWIMTDSVRWLNRQATQGGLGSPKQVFDSDNK